jgi:hypothetical protein
MKQSKLDLIKGSLPADASELVTKTKFKMSVVRRGLKKLERSGRIVKGANGIYTRATLTDALLHLAKVLKDPAASKIYTDSLDAYFNPRAD